MQIVLMDGARAHELEVVVHDPEATVADLVTAVAGDRAHGLVLLADRTPIPFERRLDRAGIRSGAEIRLLPSNQVTTDPVPVEGNAPAPLEVAVVGGLDAGRRTPIGPGRWPIGRDTEGVSLANDTVSSHHATLEVGGDARMSLVDEGSLNGTWVGGVPALRPTPVRSGTIARLGAVQITVRRPTDDDRPATLVAGPAMGGPSIPFNRPPRPAPPGAPEPFDTPDEPREQAGPSAVGIMSILAPLAFGGIMVAVTGQIFYALFTLLSPVMIIGTSIDARRRGKTGRRKERARYERELGELAEKLRGMAADERVRLEDEIPDPAEIQRRAAAPSTRLWERRPGHPDWLHLRIGLGDAPWEPPVRTERRSQPEEVRTVLRDGSRITDAPVMVDLTSGGVVGLVGSRAATVALARSLVVQAATLHGPADLPAVVLCGEDRDPDWDWTKWLPHTADPSGSGQRIISADRERSEAILRAMLEAADARRVERGSSPLDDETRKPGPATLLVLDDESLIEGRRSPARSVLRGAAGRVAGIVIAPTEDRLPAVCSTIVEIIDDDGSARVHHVRAGVLAGEVLATGVSDRSARRTARHLARLDDPELDVAGAGLPPIVALLPLLALDPPDPTAITERWAAGGADPDLVAPIGVSEDGILTLDLVRDGPHGLVAGTTGSGKSELLRSLVAGLAASSSPDACTFVLVDFKGGSAFAECARLPHTVGMVTDLDAHLAERALRCLEAELRYRERVLRDFNASDLPAYRRLTGDNPVLSRLVVVIDEFATLKAELPDFVESLVGVAQRGRSLGVHMVLATQRPSGAVSENIRANTNLRIALRVQDTSDSADVIDVNDAARIGRNQPGRALARLGPGEVIPVQTALSTGVSGGGHGPVELRAFRFGGGPVHGAGTSERTEGRSDLAKLVDACLGAHEASGRPAPRRPWPDPLPGEVALEGLLDQLDDIAAFGQHGALLPFTLADRPDEQTQTPWGWIPSDGNLLLIGLPGTGTTTTLGTIATVAARVTSPDELHLYVLDFGTGELDALAGLPHTGAVVPAGDRERQVRLVAQLKAELERRRGLRSPRTTEPRILLMVDGMSTFKAEWDDVIAPVLDDFARVFSEGPELGVSTVVTADRGLAVPNALRGLARQQLLFRLGDDLDYSNAGFRRGELPEFGPGRALDAETHREVQLARSADGLEAAVAKVVAATGPVSRPPAPVGSLPSEVSTSTIVGHARLDALPFLLPLGISDHTLEPTGLTLYEGEHALIVGPARSGRTTALATAAASAGAGGWRTAAVASRRSWLSQREDMSVLDPSRLAIDLPPLTADTSPLLLVVDDAETIEDADGALADALGHSHVVVVAAGRADAIRGLYSHWTRTVRQSRAGVLLQADVDLDGDLLGVRLPRRTTTAVGPGRGWLCTDGACEIVQIAQPDPS